MVIIIMIYQHARDLILITTVSTILWDFALRSYKEWEQTFPHQPHVYHILRQILNCSSHPSNIFHFSIRGKKVMHSQSFTGVLMYKVSFPIYIGECLQCTKKCIFLFPVVRQSISHLTSSNWCRMLVTMISTEKRPVFSPFRVWFFNQWEGKGLGEKVKIKYSCLSVNSFQVKQNCTHMRNEMWVCFVGFTTVFANKTIYKLSACH